jgi:hypothetical protein
MTPKISKKPKVLRSMILKEMIFPNIGTYAIYNMVTIHFFLEKILSLFSNSQLYNFGLLKNTFKKYN